MTDIGDLASESRNRHSITLVARFRLACPCGNAIRTSE